jgi:ADP-heptose:LPS heptosyltransferase
MADTPYAVMAPGSRWPSKRWPIERFTEMVEPLLKRGFEHIIVIGSASERQQAGALLEQGGRIVDLVGSTSVGQTLAIVAGAGLVIANDSAPLHMAVGFDRPSIALFGPTDPAAVGPYARAECVVRAYQPQAGVPVNYKDDRLGDSLMRLISTAMALQAVDRVLALWPKRSKDVRGSSFMTRGEATHHEPRTTNHEPHTSINILPRGLEPKATSS